MLGETRTGIGDKNLRNPFQMLFAFKLHCYPPASVFTRVRARE